MPIYYFGTDEQKREWLPDLASGKKLAAFGLTEPDAGSDAGASRTRAELRDGKWVVNGSKIFITNAGTDITACVTITAQTGDGEISNVIVPNGTPGYEISGPMKKLGWRASDRVSSRSRMWRCRSHQAPPWSAAASEVVRLQLTDHKVKRQQLARADEILREVQAEDLPISATRPRWDLISD